MTEPRSGWLNGMFGYWRDNGEFLPAIAGAADDDDSSSEDENSDNEESDDDEDSDDEEQNLDEIRDPKAKLAAEMQKQRRLSKRLKTAEAALADATKKLEEADNATKTEQQKAQERADAAEKKVEELERKLVETTKKSLVSEHEDLVKLSTDRRKTALKLIDLDDVEIDDDGESNIDDVIAELKSEAPFLFENGTSDEEGEEEETTPKRRSAPPPKRRKDKSASDNMDLITRMPHLAKHVKR